MGKSKGTGVAETGVAEPGVAEMFNKERKVRIQSSLLREELSKNVRAGRETQESLHRAEEQKQNTTDMPSRLCLRKCKSI